MNDTLQVVIAIVTPIASAVGAYAAIKVDQAWQKREIDRAHNRLDKHDEHFEEIWKRGQI